MKTKKVIKKFDLEKMEVAKLKDLESIVGGDDLGTPGDATITDLVTSGKKKRDI